MARKKRGSNSEQPIGVGLTAKQMKRKNLLINGYLIDIEPLSDNQKRLFDSYNHQKNIVAYGCAGTGKTFVTLYKALSDVLDESTPYEKIYLVRSLVSTREIGFLLVIMRTKQTSIKYHTRIWSSICFRCPLMQILRCSMVI